MNYAQYDDDDYDDDDDDDDDAAAAADDDADDDDDADAAAAHDDDDHHHHHINTIHMHITYLGLSLSLFHTCGCALFEVVGQLIADDSS